MGQETLREDILKTEYSYDFDEKRKNSMVTSYYKYGAMSENYGGKEKNVDAIASLKKRLELYEQTGNTDYLVDVANFEMIEYMYPREGSYYKAGTSDESPGVVGLSVGELKMMKEGFM